MDWKKQKSILLQQLHCGTKNGGADKGKLIIIANAFQKKSQKTPKQEIERALKIKKEYETEK